MIIVTYLLWAWPASADTTVVLLVTGGADASTQLAAEGAAADRFKDAGWTVKHAADVGVAGKAGEELIRCVREPSVGCGSRLLPPLHVDQAALVDVTVEKAGDLENNVVVTGWVLDGATGKISGNDRRYCERCTADDLAAKTRELVGSLLHASRAREGQAILRIRSTPPGARVTIDNDAVGVTDLEYTVDPGSHKVTIEKRGFGIVVRTVSVQPNQTVDVPVTLAGVGDEPHGGNGWKWVLGGVGLGGIAAGTTLILLDEPDISNGSRRAERLATFLPGVITAGAGAVLVATSVYLILHTTRRPAVAASVGPQSLYVSFTGAF